MIKDCDPREHCWIQVVRKGREDTPEHLCYRCGTTYPVRINAFTRQPDWEMAFSEAKEI